MDYGRNRAASAELTRLLRLPASALVQPLEPPHLQVTLVPGDCPADELIELALFGLAILLLDYLLGVKEKAFNAVVAMFGVGFSAYSLYRLHALGPDAIGGFSGTVATRRRLSCCAASSSSITPLSPATWAPNSKSANTRRASVIPG